MLHVQHCNAIGKCFTVRRSRVQRPIMTNVTWSRFDQSAQQLVVGHTTKLNVKENRWEHCRWFAWPVGFSQKLSTIDDVTKYRGIPVSRYFLRRYIIVGHFLITRIPTRTSDVYNTQDDLLVVYKSFIRPRVEFCVKNWNPHFLKDEEVIEKVQKRATKCVKGMKGKKYWLHILGLTTLKRRRIRGDLIETFKILSGKENVDSETFFQLADSSRHTTGYSRMLYKRHCRLDARKFFFSQRVANSWNSLP